MSSDHTTLSWNQRFGTVDERRLRIAEASRVVRSVTVPAGPGYLFTVLGDRGKTSEPADDLLRLESWLRLRVTQHDHVTDLVYREYRTARREHGHAAADVVWWWTHWRRGRRLFRRLRATITEWAAGRSAVLRTQWRLDAVRQFVIGLDVPGGVLAPAGRAWQRNSAPPPFVSVLVTENVFLQAAPRRASAVEDAAPTIGGGRHGTAWRRDGDDEDPWSRERSVRGFWQLGSIPATGEVYAVFRHQQVWLLARGVTDPDQTHLLTGLMRGHMLEPNSLLHAAHTAHHAARTATAPSIRRDPSGQDGR
jgi:hypothetical protein